MLLAAVALTVLALGATPAGQPQTAGIDRPTDAEVARALERVKKDPNLATDRTIRMLRWKRSQETKRESRLPEWLIWLAGLFKWVEQSARVLVWIAVIGLGGALGVYLVRMVMARGAAGAFETFIPPTHVRDLDIRPESLPAEIGAAARALWDRGEPRAALAARSGSATWVAQFSTAGLPAFEGGVRSGLGGSAGAGGGRADVSVQKLAGDGLPGGVTARAQ